MTHKERFFGVNHYAAPTLGCPAMLYDIDRSVFSKNKPEKELVAGFKTLLGKTKNHQFKTIVKGSY